MPMESNYRAIVRIIVGLADLTEYEAAKTRANNFISAQITAATIGAESKPRFYLNENPGGDPAYWMKTELLLDISDFASADTLDGILETALDQYSDVIDYEFECHRKLTSWTAPA